MPKHSKFQIEATDYVLILAGVLYPLINQALDAKLNHTPFEISELLISSLFLSTILMSGRLVVFLTLVYPLVGTLAGMSLALGLLARVIFIESIYELVKSLGHSWSLFIFCCIHFFLHFMRNKLKDKLKQPKEGLWVNT